MKAPQFPSGTETTKNLLTSSKSTMIGKLCEEKKIKCHGREEHRDNIHHWAENLLEFA